jgi:hypothetical protein
MQRINIIILIALMFIQAFDIVDNHSLNMIIICVFFFLLRLYAVSGVVSHTTELILNELHR